MCCILTCLKQLGCHSSLIKEIQHLERKKLFKGPPILLVMEHDHTIGMEDWYTKSGCSDTVCC